MFDKSAAYFTMAYINHKSVEINHPYYSYMLHKSNGCDYGVLFTAVFVLGLNFPLLYIV